MCIRDRSTGVTVGCLWFNHCRRSTADQGSHQQAPDACTLELQYGVCTRPSCIDCAPSSVEQLRRTLDATHPDELRHDGVVLGDGALLDELEAFQLGSFVSVFDHGAGAQVCVEGVSCNWIQSTQIRD
eukprot:TRINITY_DN13704_c0_g2_i7.p2 TRINITY_DN13704_c0_g2~~TRINITY_DN13704_c0_g2_i7.p2  ORF type:complete len:128 (+),score=13.99 TRINITY_DN13704_c0_g2_i7:126-509(+)